MLLHRLLLTSLLLAGLSAGEAATVVRTPELMRFRAEEPFAFNGSNQAQYDRAGHLATLPATAAEYDIALTPPGDNRPGCAKPATVTLSAQLTGDRAAVAIVMIDEQGEEFGLANSALQAGANQVTWRMDRLGKPWGAAGDGKPTGMLRVMRVILIRYPGGTEPAQVRLDSLVATQELHPSDLVTVRLVTPEPTAVLAPGKLNQASFAVQNGHDAPLALSWRLVATLADGSTIASQPLPLELAAGAGRSLALPAGADAVQGVHRLAWTLTDAAGGEVAGEVRIAVLRLAGAEPRFREHFAFGCEPGQSEAELRLQRDLGLDVLRYSDDWIYYSAAPGVYDWERVLPQARRIRELGMDISWLTAYAPGWALTPGTKPAERGWQNARPPLPEAWRTYMRQLAANTKGLARYYEIWNEADWHHFFTGTGDHYLEMLRIAHEELRAADPALRIISSGMAGDCGDAAFQTRVATEGKGLFDFYGWHQHGGFAEYFQPGVDGRVAQMTALAGKPVFYTETAVPSGDDWASQTAQGEELVKKVTYAWARGARAYQWFRFADHDECWGLVRRDLSPKPALATYATLIRLLRGLRPTGRLDLGSERYALVFAEPAGKRQVVVHWRENRSLPDADFRLAVGTTATVLRCDLQGNETSEPVFAGDVRLAPRLTPGYLLISGAPPITAAAPLAIPPITTALVPGAPLDLDLTLGAATAGTMRLTLALPGKADEQPQAIALAGGVQRAVLRTQAPATVPADGRLAGRLQYAVDGAWRGELVLPFEVARRVPLGPLGAAPLFVLGGDNVVNRFANDPIAKARWWGGADDLSARLWFGCDQGRLLLRVEVRDAQHDQGNAAEQAWQADGVQVAFRAEGQQGMWELGLSRRGETAEAHVFATVQGAQPGQRPVQVAIAPIPGGLRYEASMALADVGLTAEQLAKGLRFNAIVNDSDGGNDRRQYLRIAPGIAETKSMAQAPLVILGGP